MDSYKNILQGAPDRESIWSIELQYFGGCSAIPTVVNLVNRVVGVRKCGYHGNHTAAANKEILGHRHSPRGTRATSYLE
jgi:hypothetical protein